MDLSKEYSSFDAGGIEYKLTDYALTLENIWDALSDWGTKHRARIRLRMKEDAAGQKNKGS